PWLHMANLLPKEMGRKFVTLMPKRLKNKIHGLDNFTLANLTIAHRRFTSVVALREMGLGNGLPFIPLPPLNLDQMGQISWAEIYGYMIPMLLRDSDQMSMAVGLEIRIPFLDHHLVEAVLSLSQKHKKGNVVKPLLVEAYKDELPSEVYNR